MTTLGTESRVYRLRIAAAMLALLPVLGCRHLRSTDRNVLPKGALELRTLLLSDSAANIAAVSTPPERGRHAQGVADLIALLTHRKEQVRGFAANELHKLANSTLSFARNPEEYCYLDAWRLGQRSLATSLVELIQSSDPAVHFTVANVLTKLMTADALARDQALDPLIAVLSETDNSVRARSLAAQTLGAIREARAVRPLMAILPKDGAPPLDDRLAHEECELHEHVAIALGRIGPPAKNAVPSLERLIRYTAKERVRKAAQSGLRRIEPPRRREED